MLCKAKMWSLSPFEETLYLDADTVVLGDLDYGFAIARRHGIACTVSANPWQRRYRWMRPDHRDETEYSSGAVFFDKSYGCARRVFRRWSGMTGDTATVYVADDQVRVQNHNDQALFTAAMAREGFNPRVLPQNWNLCPKWQKSFFGPVKIWHGTEPVPASLLAWNEEQSKEGAVIKAAQLP
jgi:lipopolysaccharide biosynthesis glycosyltransferase